MMIKKKTFRLYYESAKKDGGKNFRIVLSGGQRYFPYHAILVWDNCNGECISVLHRYRNYWKSEMGRNKFEKWLEELEAKK